MSVDISPDGRTLVFDLLGQLYTVPLEGGRARRITTGDAFNRQPRYSPNGQSIAFISDQGGSANLWVSTREGGSPRRLSDLNGHRFNAITSPSWAPDGKSVLVSQSLSATRQPDVILDETDPWRLATYQVATGTMRWLSDTADHSRSVLGGTFARRAAVIYAAANMSSSGESADFGTWRLVRIDAASGRSQPMMSRRVGRDGVRPVVSPDGRLLAYCSSSGTRMGIRLRDLLTGQERWLVREVIERPPFFPGSDSRDLSPGYAFTPDGGSMVVAYGGKLHVINVATGKTSLIDFIADIHLSVKPPQLKQFAIADTGVRTRSVMQPTLSPDGRRVAFSALSRIWVMDIPTAAHTVPPSVSPPYRLTSDSIGEFYPSWSPDGRWIVYSTWMDANGGAVRRAWLPHSPYQQRAPTEQLTNDTAIYFHVVVSTDGRRIFAVRASMPSDGTLGLNGVADCVLVWIPVTGGAARSIAPLSAEYHSPGARGFPVDQLYLGSKSERVYVGLHSWTLGDTSGPNSLVFLGHANRIGTDKLSAVLSPDGGRAIAYGGGAILEIRLPKHRTTTADTFDLERAQSRRFESAGGAVHRWGVGYDPWISWSLNGRRVLFSQGGSLFVGDVQPFGWTTFVRVDVPLTIPPDRPGGILVLRGARLITMRGYEIIERGDLVIDRGRIAAVGARGTITIPPSARIVDVSGKTVLPGYIDVHDHMLLAKGVHPQQCWQCLVRLAWGITAIRDPQPQLSNEVFAYRERERSGTLLSPRIFSTGTVYLGTDPVVRTLEAAHSVVMPYSDYFDSETYKVYYDAAAARSTWRLLAAAAADEGLNSTAHIHGFEMAVTVALDGFTGLEHNPQLELYDDVATLIARSGIIHTQTYAVLPGVWHYMFDQHPAMWRDGRMRRFMPPAARDFFESAYTSELLGGAPELGDLLSIVRGAARIVARGGRVAIGSHGDIPGVGFHFEMWLHALGGMKTHDILRSATIIGATALGHAADLGSLEVGKLADLQILDGNPLEDINNTASVKYVVKGGRLYSSDDLAEIWPASSN